MRERGRRVPNRPGRRCFWARGCSPGLTQRRGVFRTFPSHDTALDGPTLREFCRVECPSPATSKAVFFARELTLLARLSELHAIVWQQHCSCTVWWDDKTDRLEIVRNQTDIPVLTLWEAEQTRKMKDYFFCMFHVVLGNQVDRVPTRALPTLPLPLPCNGFCYLQLQERIFSSFHFIDGADNSVGVVSPFPLPIPAHFLLPFTMHSSCSSSHDSCYPPCTPAHWCSARTGRNVRGPRKAWLGPLSDCFGRVSVGGGCEGLGRA